MALIISKECEASSDPDWCRLHEDNGLLISRHELVGIGDKIVIAFSGNPRFFQRLSEYGHVFVIEPVADTKGTVRGTDFLSDEFLRQGLTDKNRYSLMTQDGESTTLEFVNDRDGFIGEMTYEFVAEVSAVPQTQ